jgi:hypothetical protein
MASIGDRVAAWARRPRDDRSSEGAERAPSEPSERLFDDAFAGEAPERSRGAPSGSAGDTAERPPALEEEGDVADEGVEGDWERPTLGDISEGRREAMRRRLGALRGSRDPSREARLAGAATAVRRGAAAAGGAIAGGGRTVGTAAAEGGRRVADRWLTLPLLVRQRVGAGIALAAVAALVWFVLIPAAPCQFPGGDRCPPEDQAIELVPADAAVYVHMNLGPDTEQYEAAAGIAERLPALVGDVVGQLPAAAGRAVDYDAEIRPWSGGELAIALLPSATGIDRVLLVESNDDEAALEFGRSLLEPQTREREVDGVEVTVDGEDLATAIHDGFLLLGPEPTLSQVIATADGEIDVLADDADATEALDQLPDHRLAELYISGDGARTLGADGALGPFETFVNSGATRGVAAALAFGEDSIELKIRSLLDPERSEAQPGVLGALAEFEPELTEEVRSDALAYLGLGNPSASVDRLLEQAAADAPELTRGIDRFNRELREEGGVNLRGDLLPLLEGEAAITVEPPTVPGADAEEEEAPGAPFDAEAPYVGLIATGVDVDSARLTLAELQGPIAATIDPERTGQAPVFRSTEIDGVEVQSLRVSPVVDLSYALYDGRLVAGSKRQAVERARAEGEPLDDADGYEEAAEGLPDELVLLLYLNLTDLFALGEQIGLGEDPGYVLRAQDLRTLRAAVLAVARGEDELATDLRLTVGESPEPLVGEPPLEEPPVDELPPAEDLPPPAEDPGGEVPGLEVPPPGRGQG